VLPGVKIGSVVAAAALAGAAVLFSPAAPRAFAADGTFTYTGGDGALKTSANPPSDECLKVGGRGPVRNNTNADLILYKAPDCTPANRIAKVDAGSAQKNVPTFHALLWTSD
jgi:hypothetical protein